MDLFPHSDYMTKTFLDLDRNSKTIEEDGDGHPTWAQPNYAFFTNYPRIIILRDFIAPPLPPNFEEKKNVPEVTQFIKDFSKAWSIIHYWHQLPCHDSNIDVKRKWIDSWIETGNTLIASNTPLINE